MAKPQHPQHPIIPVSGSPIELVLLPNGGGHVRVNGLEMPGVTSIYIEADATEPPRLTIEAIYPYPPKIGPDGEVMMTTFSGVFVAVEEWERLRKGEEI